MRCETCGNRYTDSLDDCPTCQPDLWAIETSAGNTAAPMAFIAPGEAAVSPMNQGQTEVTLPTSRGQRALRQSGSAAAIVASIAQGALAHVIPAKRTVHGQVIIAETTGTEKPDLDVCKILTRILWIMMLLPIFIAAAAICLLFRKCAPLNLFAMLGVFRFLNPVAQNTVLVPVRYFRIQEDGSEAEVMVRMKGQFTHGNMGPGDLVTLCGWSRSGTLFATHGYNHRTAASIRIAHSWAWVSLVLTLLFILYLVVKCHELGGAR